MSPSGLAGSLTATRESDQKFCFACGHVIHSSAMSCPHCGAGQARLAVSSHVESLESQRSVPEISPLAANHVYCRGCGAGIHESALACPKCGAPQQVGGTAFSGRRNRVTAALLALLLGGLGAHKFYLGSIFLGLLYLLFFWTAIPALIGLIEGVYYLTLTDEEFGRKYGS